MIDKKEQELRTSLTHVFKIQDKVEVIETNMSMYYVMHKSTAIHSLNAIA